MRGSSSYLGDCRWPKPPSRAEIPVDRESQGIRPVEGIGCARFQVAGKLGRLLAGWAGATGPPWRAPDPSGVHCLEKIGKDGAASGWRGKAAGLSAGVRVAGGAPAVVPARTEDSRCWTSRAAGPGRDRAAPRRAAVGDPQSGAGPAGHPHHW